MSNQFADVHSDLYFRVQACFELSGPEEEARNQAHQAAVAVAQAAGLFDELYFHFSV